MTFLERKYATREHALDPFTLRLLRDYTLFDEGQDFSPEDPRKQVPGVHSRYGDPLMESLLLHMTPIMQEVTGLTLFPTYSYYRVYRRGSELKPHIDRPACEISASLCLGYTDETIDWPLYVEDTSFVMKPGDLIAYRGLELNHFRYPLECPYSWSQSQVFLHYVDADGPHAEWRFDKRGALGVKK